MATVACPACSTQTSQVLESSSQYASVVYHRCPACHHVWTVAKDDPTRIEHVTPLPEDPPPQS